MANPTRRALLGAFLGGASSGLLLPWQGRGGLILPDKAAVAKLPVIVGDLPVSAECAALRQLRREMVVERCPWQGVPVRELDDPIKTAEREANRRRHWEFRARHEELTRAMYARPATTWSDCVALAEIAWHWAIKDGNELSCYRGTGRLSLHVPKNDLYGAATAYLVDAVLSLGGGERFDPHLARHGIEGGPIHG